MPENVVLRTGATMQIVGLGTWQAKGAEIEEAVRVALETGYRHIDTAYVYQNEESVGKALKHAFDTGLVRREDIFVTTKLPNNGHRRERVSYFLKKSLDRLQLDYVDLYLIHSPLRAKGKHDDDNLPMEDGKFTVDTETDMLQTWKGMEDVVDAGLAKAIGLSNFNSEQIKRIYDNSRIKPANLQVECHAYFAQKKLFEFCKSLNISFTAYAPLGSPHWRQFQKDRFNRDVGELPSPLEDPALKPLAEKYDKKPSQILLRWLIQKGIIVIPKSSNPARIKENFQVFDFELSSKDMAIVDSLDRNERYFKSDYFPGILEHPDHPYKIPF